MKIDWTVVKLTCVTIVICLLFVNLEDLFIRQYPQSSYSISMVKYRKEQSHQSQIRSIRDQLEASLDRLNREYYHSIGCPNCYDKYWEMYFSFSDKKRWSPPLLDSLNNSDQVSRYITQRDKCIRDAELAIIGLLSS